MEAWIDELLCDLQKNLQKICVQTIGRASSQKAYLDRQRAQQQGKKELAVAKATLSTSTTKLNTAVKGKFGNKINEALEEQQRTLEEW